MGVPVAEIETAEQAADIDLQRKVQDRLPQARDRALRVCPDPSCPYFLGLVTKVAFAMLQSEAQWN